MNVTQQKLLTPGQVAETLNVSRQTLWRWRNEGTGPPYLKMGNGSVRYLPLKLPEQVAQQ